MKHITILSLIVVIGLLSLGLVSASWVSILPTNESSDHIFPGEVASYNLTISNTDASNLIYSWSSNPVEWIIESTTSSLVKSGETLTQKLLIKPNPTRLPAPGFYVVPLTVKTADGSEKIDKQIGLYVQNINELIYSNYVFASLSLVVDESVDPRKPLSVKANIRNRNIIDVDNLTLLLSGEGFDIVDHLSLGGLEEKTMRYNIDLDPSTKPGTYKLVASLMTPNKTVSEVKELFDVIPYATIDRLSQEKSFFFKTTKISTMKNNGNVLKSLTMDLDIDWFDSLFSTVNIEADSLEQNSRSSWVLSLEPGETVTVTVVKNYRSLVVLVLLIIIAIITYFSIRSPIVMKKQIIVTGKDDEGISEMKIRIYLKNRTDKSFFNLRLIDKVPSIADVKTYDSLGVLEPTKIVRTEKKGTIVKWDFDSLEAYEERILTYAIKARLKIIGNIGLPPVRIKFETVKGKQKTTESGKAVVGTKK